MGCVGRGMKVNSTYLETTMFLGLLLLLANGGYIWTLLVCNSPKELVRSILTVGEHREREMVIMSCCLYSLWLLKINKIFGGGLEFYEAVVKFESLVERFLVITDTKDS